MPYFISVLILFYHLRLLFTNIFLSDFSNETVYAFVIMNRGSVVGIANGYGLDNQEVWVRVHVVQTGSGVHPTSYPMGTGGSFPGVKRHGREADHSPPASAEVKKMWIYTSTPTYAFMA
jgi:hypothetical protein